MKNSFRPFVFVIAHLGLPQQVWDSIDETWDKFQDHHCEVWGNENGRRKLEMGVGLDFVVPEKTSPWEMVQFKVLLDQEFGDTRFIELAMSYCNIPIKEITWEALYCLWKDNTDNFYKQVMEAMEADMTEEEKYWGPLPTVEYLGALYCVEIDPGSYSASLVTTPEGHTVHEPTRSNVLDLFEQMHDVPNMMREARIEQAIIDAGGLEAYYHEEPHDPHQMCASEEGDMYVIALSDEQDWKDMQPDVADEDLGKPDAGAYWVLPPEEDEAAWKAEMERELEANIDQFIKTGEFKARLELNTLKSQSDPLCADCWVIERGAYGRVFDKYGYATEHDLMPPEDHDLNMDDIHECLEETIEEGEYCTLDIYFYELYEELPF